mmetsp:Transcript_110443/g.352109  ORF Transcript_110443/g.352109 Transcript_110443/m.352109 type:complete len:294 (-) Transcript_110443:2484-3365(-)
MHEHDKQRKFDLDLVVDPIDLLDLSVFPGAPLHLAAHVAVALEGKHLANEPVQLAHVAVAQWADLLQQADERPDLKRGLRIGGRQEQLPKLFDLLVRELSGGDRLPLALEPVLKLHLNDVSHQLHKLREIVVSVVEGFHLGHDLRDHAALAHVPRDVREAVLQQRRQLAIGDIAAAVAVPLVELLLQVLHLQSREAAIRADRIPPSFLAPHHGLHHGLCVAGALLLYCEGVLLRRQLTKGRRDLRGVRVDARGLDVLQCLLGLHELDATGGPQEVRLLLGSPTPVLGRNGDDR